MNTCKDVRRSAWMRHVDKRIRLEDLPVADTGSFETDDAVTRVVMKLPRKQKEVVLLYYYSGLLMEKTAEVLRTKGHKVSYQLTLAKAALHDVLKELFVDDE